jgi:hypothetical protein
VNDVIKKADVMKKAKGAKLHCSEKDYVKIMKELCTSKGGNWSLRKE